MSKWISVDDEMPELGQKVLVRIPVCKSFEIEGGEYRGDGKFLGAWCNCRGRSSHYQVSHWMPCPEMPEDD
jgi:hypothetical protein